MTKVELGAVLVASDMSEGSDEVVRTAASLAAVAGARLQVLHVMELEAAPYVEMAGLDASFPGRVEAAERTLQEQVGRVVGDRVPASGKVVIDTVHRALLAEAEEVGAGLIVLGPHRKRPIADGMLGSTADRVIRGSGVPSLIVRGELRFPLRRVVTPFDMSEAARQAVRVAADWSGTFGEGGELRVVHVVPKAFIGDEFHIDVPAIERALHEHVEAALEGGERPIEVAEEVVWGEQPADDIVRYAADQRADLIVLATHGRGAFKRLLIGSVASHVVRHARGPVLLVPPQAWRDDD